MKAKPWKKAALAVGCLVMTAAPMQVMAWGREGHKIVAAIAWAHLDTQAKAAVRQLLSVEGNASMVSVAPWADEVRNRYTSKWHYTDFPKGDCNYKHPRDCQRGECLVNAVNHEAKILGDRSQPIAKREKALKYIIHLAGGDSSQPLHNWKPGGGANDYQVQFQGRGTNLHHLWDTGMIRDMATPKKGLSALLGRGRPNYRALRKRLVQESMSARGSSSTNPVAWVEHSCHIANEPGIYPKGHKITASYLAQWEPVVANQLIRGGMHLAAILNLELGKGSD